MSLRLSAKHGLNPSVSSCFWCDKTKNEIILFGAGYRDPKTGKKGAEAPRAVVLNYDPCDECAQKFAQGIWVIEASPRPLSDNQPSMAPQQEAYPTGRYIVIREEAVDYMVQDEELRQQIKDKKAMFVEPSVFGVLAPPEPEKT